MKRVFPKDFVWGAASSAYQIEGHSTEDGGGASIWDTFTHTPGKIDFGDTGDIACDAYHRYAEDIALLKQTGGEGLSFFHQLGQNRSPCRWGLESGGAEIL